MRRGTSGGSTPCRQRFAIAAAAFSAVPVDGPGTRVGARDEREEPTEEATSYTRSHVRRTSARAERLNADQVGAGQSQRVRVMAELDLVEGADEVTVDLNRHRATGAKGGRDKVGSKVKELIGGDPSG